MAMRCFSTQAWHSLSAIFIHNFIVRCLLCSPFSSISQQIKVPKISLNCSADQFWVMASKGNKYFTHHFLSVSFTTLNVYSRRDLKLPYLDPFIWKVPYKPSGPPLNSASEGATSRGSTSSHIPASALPARSSDGGRQVSGWSGFLLWHLITFLCIFMEIIFLFWVRRILF